MIAAIDKKYCIDNLVQLMPHTDSCHLIVSVDEIILLKNGDNVIINKYSNHPNRHLFPFSDKEQMSWNHFTELYEYNKVYLDFRGNVGGFRFDKNYFFKGKDRALYLEEGLSLDERSLSSVSTELTREEIEEIFNSNNYDSMYVIDRNGNVLFAKNKKDGICIGKPVIPSDEEIIKMELKDRKVNYNIASKINAVFNTEGPKEEIIAEKTIEEIENFKVYGPYLFGEYSDMLLTVKDGKFNLKWFRIDFVCKDRFRLTTAQIPVVEPTVDDVLCYSNKFDIEYMHEPESSIIIADNSENEKMEEVAQETEYKDGDISSKKDCTKKISGIFKRNKKSGN